METREVENLIIRIGKGNVSGDSIDVEVGKVFQADLSRVHPEALELLTDLAFSAGFDSYVKQLMTNRQYNDNRVLLDSFRLVKDGEYFPTCNPYNEDEDNRWLNELVERGFVSRTEMDETLKEMKKTEIYNRLKQSHLKTYILDHTPFARNGNGMNDFGYHVFIGREVFDEGHSNIVIVDALGSTSGGSLEGSFEEICDCVKKKRKVLLTKSPGRWVSPPGPYHLAPRTYVPFEAAELKQLSRKFEASAEMKGHENPFLYQPQ
jgi:hypothetical protein